MPDAGAEIHGRNPRVRKCFQGELDALPQGGTAPATRCTTRSLSQSVCAAFR
jgi:hypothetical protein